MSIMQSLFGSKSRELIGLDISSSTIKLVELARRGDRYAVESYAIEPLPANAVADKQILDPQAVGECIVRAVNRSGTRTRQAALAVSGASVITKIIQMPESLSELDLEEQIKVEADQYIPYSIDEVALDFQVLGASAVGAGQVDVMLAACRKDQVETRCAALEIAGLTPKIVDIEANALQNSALLLRHQMPDRGHNRTIALIDMGATTTSVLVLQNLQAVYTRDQSFGGRQLLEDMMRYYGMTLEEASQARRFNNLPDGFELEVLAPFVADMGQQIDRSLQFFFASTSQHGQIDQIILAGGCAAIDHVDRQLADQLQIPVAVAQPFAHVGVAARAKPAQLARDSASLLIASGLAMRAFDPEA
ncbi:pilus assembly protein PilM [Hydrocarboniphaga sp.]|uniref:pilus assembly protein PilM n=1 Tax=Hydrocarboniphaga sp. TaxID=2033016 RepID=UPI002AB89050|nr:pilus assembly protein PilM [Hydrocarboniphaga sp.]MDZ4077517.1 pilus assembly protein PilM [Hydrocarboniphaga sp.]